MLYHYIFGITSPPDAALSGDDRVELRIRLHLPELLVAAKAGGESGVLAAELFWRISYGIYMYHPLVGYTLRYTLLRWCVDMHWLLLSAIYFVLFIGITIGTAAFSYRYFEQCFSTCAICIRNGKPLKQSQSRT